MDKQQFDLVCKTILGKAKQEKKTKAAAMEVGPNTFFLIGAVPFPEAIAWNSELFAKHEKKMLSVFGDVMLEVLYSRNACDSAGSRVARDKDLNGLLFLTQFNHASKYGEEMVACFEMRMEYFRVPRDLPSPPLPAGNQGGSSDAKSQTGSSSSPGHQEKKPWWKFW